MSILVGFLYVIEVLVCLLLGLVVMLQKPKEGGLGGAIAGGMGEAVFGADASNVLIKATAWLGAIFLAGLAWRDLPGQHASAGASDVNGELFAHGRRG